MPGRKNISPATGVPRLNLKGESYGKPKNARAHRTRWSLAHRQTVPRSAHLRKHWDEQSCPSREVSREAHRRASRDDDFRRTARSLFSRGRNQILIGASTQAKFGTRCEG